MDRFPFESLPPRGLTIRMAGVAASGGVAMVGPGQFAELDGGGWWAADYELAVLGTPRKIKLLRAMLMRMRAGTREIEVPFIDDPQAPWSPGDAAGPQTVPFSDGSTFSDGSGFATPRITFKLEEAIEENAGEALVRRVHGGDLMGGELFTLVHAEAVGARAYCIDSVRKEGPDLFRVGFGPPARGPAPAGAVADFEAPRCVMTLASKDGAEWPRIERPFKGRSSLRFVESFDYLGEA